MNDAPKTAGRWTWPTAWQWGVIAWLVILNMSPYVIGIMAAGSLSRLEWLVWSMLAGPFAHTAMLTFFLLVGASPASIRRLAFVAGMLAILGILMLILERDAVATLFWFLLEAITFLVLMLVSAWLFRVPPKPTRWLPQFSIAEILALSGLIGIFLLLIRVVGATDFDFWRQAQDISFITFAICSGIYLYPICLPILLDSRTKRTAMIVFCLLLWMIFPLIVLGAMIVLEPSLPLSNDAYVILFYPAFAGQLILVWGTYFPIRAWLPGLLKRTSNAALTAARCKSDTLAGDPENCQQSEHTDVPD